MGDKDYIDWWKENKEMELKEVETTFMKLFSRAEFLPSIYQPILYKYLKGSQMKFWDREVFTFTTGKIREIENKVGVQAMRTTLLSQLHMLTNAYKSMVNLEERIIMMNRFRGGIDFKTTSFGLNIYNDLANTVFSSLLEIFIKFESKIDDKDLSQKNLTAQIEFLASPRRGYKKITNLVDSSIRNAISHGDVEVDGASIFFVCRKNGQDMEAETTGYFFIKELITQLFDGTSAVILALFAYLCEENIFYDEISRSEHVNEEALVFFEKLSISTLLVTCNRIYLSDNDKKNDMLNIIFKGEDLDIDSRILLGVCVAERIFRLRKLSRNNRLVIWFKSPKTQHSFFIFKVDIVADLSQGKLTLGEAVWCVNHFGKSLMSPINDEARNEFEDNFIYYSDIEDTAFHVSEIQDISSKDKKGFSAVVYVKMDMTVNQIKIIVKEIIKQLKVLKNYGFASHKVKHGEMDADILDLIFYKKEARKLPEWLLLSENDNFIARVQYDIDMKFSIQNGDMYRRILDSRMDKQLMKYREEQIEYRWNRNFYKMDNSISKS